MPLECGEDLPEHGTGMLQTRCGHATHIGRSGCEQCTDHGTDMLRTWHVHAAKSDCVCHCHVVNMARTFWKSGDNKCTGMALSCCGHGTAIVITMLAILYFEKFYYVLLCVSVVLCFGKTYQRNM